MGATASKAAVPRGEQNRKNPHIPHKSAPPRKSTHPHFRTIFERSSSRNIATRYGFPTYVNFLGQKSGVRALEQGECGALGALHHEASIFFRWPIFFHRKMGKRSKAPPLHCSRARTRAIWPTRIATAVERYLLTRSTGDFVRFHKSAPPQKSTHPHWCPGEVCVWRCIFAPPLRRA